MSDEITIRHPVTALGARVIDMLSYLGGMAILLGGVFWWLARSMFAPKVRFGREALAAQMIRVGVRSFGVVAMVQLFIGIILVLQMTPPLEHPWHFGDKVAIIIAVGSFRMLGPILTAVVLSGFAGASIAAELGTMVVAEEIEAMQAMALNPVRFLVMPRVVASTIMMVVLTVFSDLLIVFGGWATSRLMLPPRLYWFFWKNAQETLQFKDFYTGLSMAAMFGLLISLIACHEGLKVTGGAEGVGKATTMTVVYSIVAIVVSACAFTAIFYVFQL